MCRVVKPCCSGIPASFKDMANWDWKKAHWHRNLQRLIQRSKLSLNIEVSGCMQLLFCDFDNWILLTNACEVSHASTPVKIPRGQKQHHEELIRIWEASKKNLGSIKKWTLPMHVRNSALASASSQLLVPNHLPERWPHASRWPSKGKLAVEVTASIFLEQLSLRRCEPPGLYRTQSQAGALHSLCNPWMPAWVRWFSF